MYKRVHKRTIKYMNVSEFRKDLSKHLDAAVQGETITIERGGVTFQVVPTNWKSELVPFSLAPATATIVSNPEKVIENIKAKPGIHGVSVVEVPTKFCKHGFRADGRTCKHGCKVGA